MFLVDMYFNECMNGNETILIGILYECTKYLEQNEKEIIH